MVEKEMKNKVYMATVYKRKRNTNLKAVLKNRATPITSKWLIITLSTPHNS